MKISACLLFCFFFAVHAHRENDDQIYVSFPGNIPLPMTKADARQDGWTSHEKGSFWKKAGLPRFFLKFKKKRLKKILIQAPRSDAFDANSYKTGVDFAPEGALIIVKNRKRERKLKLKVNDFSLPSSADKAKQEGWYEGGCFRPMGGAHYVKFSSGVENDYQTSSFVTPIYDTYGTGDLNAVVVVFGDVGANGGSTAGFDKGGQPIPGYYGCNLNSCGNPDCKTHFTNYTLNPVHIIFLNQSQPTAWPSCQVETFGECDYIQEVAPGVSVPCSCCGTEKDPSGPRNCFAP